MVVNANPPLDINQSGNDLSNSTVIIEKKGIQTIHNSFNNAKNVVILVLNKLDKNAKEELVDGLTRQMLTHFDQINFDIGRIKEEKPFIKYMALQVSTAYKSSISLYEQLNKFEKEIYKVPFVYHGHKDINIETINSHNDIYTLIKRFLGYEVSYKSSSKIKVYGTMINEEDGFREF